MRMAKCVSIAGAIATIGGRAIALVVVAGLSVASIEPLQACMICIPVPERTAADRLIESETVVLAREDDDRPFAYEPVEVLKGTYDGAPIDLFVNSSTRRKLSRFPERGVVLVHGGKEPGWRNLGYADEAYEQVVRHVIDHADQWRARDDPDRLRYFAGLLGHENRVIADLAYLEVGRAPYSEIKALGDRVKPDVVRRILGDFAYYDWRALAILMLASSDDERDHRYIKESFESTQKLHIDSHLAAWATAYVEIEGEHAIDRIEDAYFRDGTRTDAELIEIGKALSVHGTNGHIHLRDRIVAAYALLLENRTAMVGWVAKDLAAWQEWGLANQIREIAGDGVDLDMQALFAVGYYLGLAGEQGDPRDRTADALR